jgi:hypothetical protein
MVAIAEILTADGKARNPCANCVGETRNPPREARLHACSPVSRRGFLPFEDCRLASGTVLPPGEPRKVWPPVD